MKVKNGASPVSNIVTGEDRRPYIKIETLRNKNPTEILRA